MNAKQIKRLKKHFLSWSGGNPPESDDEITVYVDYGKSKEFDYEETRNVLYEWMLGHPEPKIFGMPIR
ncbi:MAG: hypothetical protein JSS27_02945 [Planctomycetes bacterium]|nr:hypothetical protein [Planctomycetota bacterium]